MQAGQYNMAKQIGGRFTIQDEAHDVLGVGGMGTVYRGVDTLTQDAVAIKELKIEVLHGNPEILERFEREADALRVLNHPNIVKVLSSTAESDHHYIVMEYVSGGSLRDLIEAQGKLSIERVLEVSLDLADALTRAHRLKIIHRDIKPANVMLAEDGTPRLTDFGVARIDQKTRMTETGMVVGTLSYLSPEALDGSKPDERQDIWAFGILLYEMLTGTRPYDGDTASAVITGILTKPVPDITEFRPDIPQELIRLINWMLEKDPDKRISSVRRVGTEIENIIRGVDSDEYNLDSDLVNEVKLADQSRFESDSDEITPNQNALNSATPATKYGIPQHTGVKVIQDESGEDMILMPARVAIKGRKAIGALFLILVVTIIGLIIALNDGDADETANLPANPTDTNGLMRDGMGLSIEQIASEIEPVDDDEVSVLLILSTGDDVTEEVRDKYQPVVVDALDTFQRNIPFSNIHMSLAPVVDIKYPEALQVFEATTADVLVLFEINGDAMKVTIQGGNQSKLEQSLFAQDIDDMRRTMFVEVEVNDPDTETVTPYILGVLGLVHTVEGDVFELMRTFAILEEIERTPATLISGGASQHYFNYFNLFLSDTPAAIEAITPAIELDGGNPIWYAMRSAAYMRLDENTPAITDATTARRIGPQGWAIPLVLEAASTEVYGIEIDLLNTAIDVQDDWFIRYLRSTFRYSTNDLEGAWEDITASIAANPQANYPYVTGFLIAMRDGRIHDAGQMLADMVRDEPNPTLGNRVYRAMFGDNNPDIVLSGMLYQGYGYIVLGQYEQVTAFAPQLTSMIADFDNLNIMLELDSETNTHRYFAGDVFSMMGLAFCATADYETSLEWLNQGIMIDSSSVLLRFIRTGAATELNMEDLVQEDVAVLLGKSDEVDQLLRVAQNKEITCQDFFDHFVSLGDA